MLTEKIDLYQHFNEKKPQGARGILTTYILQHTKEFGSHRQHPAMLIIPGGGYEFISSREGECVAIACLARNFNAFVLEYSVGKEGVFYPYPLLEAMFALLYIQETAERYQIRKKQIGGIGFSAGGHLLGLLASITNEEWKNPLFAPYKTRLMKLAFACFCYPVVTSNPDFWHKGSFEHLTNKQTKLYESLSVEKRVTSSFPISYLWTTEYDSIVDPENAFCLAEALQKKRVFKKLLVLSYGDHGGSLFNAACFPEKEAFRIPRRNKEWVDEFFHFLKEQGIDVLDKK